MSERKKAVAEVKQTTCVEQGDLRNRTIATWDEVPQEQRKMNKKINKRKSTKEIKNKKYLD